MDEQPPFPPPLLLMLASVSGADLLSGQEGEPADPLYGAAGSDFPTVPARMHQDKVQRQHDQGVANMLNSLGRRGELVQIEEKNFRLYHGAFHAGRDPGADDDSTENIDLGARWVNDETGVYWLNVSNRAGNAVWIELDDAGGGLTGTF